ncbi:membrane protein [Amycolatopsis ultiminotia]|uniref:Membrane protein n=1 Tax=Amycolatopsis ultiminotia TaxID=543629 RepID=A0ABP6YQJ4_9PSEU
MLRRLGFARNPLVRRSDRVEGVLAGVALVIALLAVPLAVAFARADIADETAASEMQLRSRHMVTATVLTTAPEQMPVGDSAPVAATSRVTAVWHVPGGAARTGMITVPTGAASTGATTPIWLDRNGRQTTAPLTHTDAVTNGVLVATFVWLCAAGLLTGALWVARRILDHRRATRWADEWAQFAGPEAVR